MNSNFKIPVDPEKDYLNQYAEILPIAEISIEREKRNKYFTQKGAQIYYPILEKCKNIKTTITDFSQESVIIGTENELDPQKQETLISAMYDLIPWRKGPWNLFGKEIDSEWRSNLKWQRCLDFFTKKNIALKNKKIADIGCNNGYFMFRMLAQNPELVIGFDPSLRYFFQFQFLNNLLAKSPLHFEMMGVEEITLFPNFFDIIFCMGVIYHNSDPIGILRKMHSALNKNGVLIIESQGIPGENQVALFPNKHYAKVPGTYFVPTINCLKNFLQKTQFKDIEVFYTHKLTLDEQRCTKWMNYESLESFLDPNDHEKTIEGYPAPIRIYIKAVKK